MRFFAPVVALFAAVACAQNSTTTGNGSSKPNAINIPASGMLSIVAGSNTITWTNPTSGTVTIKLQVDGSDIQPNSGITVASNVASSAGTATFTVDASSVAAGVPYVIEIIDDTEPSTMNFSNAFTISGATGSLASSSASSGSASMTATTSGSATSGTATTTGSATSGSSSATSSHSSASRTASASTSATSATVPGAANKVASQGSLLVFIAAAAALL